MLKNFLIFIFPLFYLVSISKATVSYMTKVPTLNILGEQSFVKTKITNIQSDQILYGKQCPREYPLNQAYSTLTNNGNLTITNAARTLVQNGEVVIDAGWHTSATDPNLHLTVWVEPNKVKCHVYRLPEIAACENEIGEKVKKPAKEFFLKKGTDFKSSKSKETFLSSKGSNFTGKLSKPGFN